MTLFNDLPICKISTLAVEDALDRFSLFNRDEDQSGCLVTFIDRNRAIEFRFESDDHFEDCRDRAFGKFVRCYASGAPVDVLVSGPCYEPGCEQYGHKVDCFMANVPVKPPSSGFVM